LTSVQQLLQLRVQPTSVAFRDAPPAGLPAWDGGEVPSGCTFWQAAQEGKCFYTVRSDHYNCAIGCYTHSIDLPEARASELSDTLELMVESSYLEMQEVPSIPRLERPPGVVAYAPTDSGAFDADAVIVACNAASAMLLYEAALKAGAGGALLNLIGRPGCAVLPLSLVGGRAAMSLGCIGNRFHTGLPDSELYFAVPGDKWTAVVGQLEQVVEANKTMTAHYSERLTGIQAAAR
jgi:uncharacterized protein (DUF169 family)